MKSLLVKLTGLFVMTLFLFSCEENPHLYDRKFKFRIGDVLKHKIHHQDVILLDTIRVTNGTGETKRLMYKVKGKDLNIHEINEVELY